MEDVGVKCDGEYLLSIDFFIMIILKVCVLFIKLNGVIFCVKESFFDWFVFCEF